VPFQLLFRWSSCSLSVKILLEVIFTIITALSELVKRLSTYRIHHPILPCEPTDSAYCVSALKQIAERQNIVLSDKVKLAEVNELLWKNQVYDKITWRLVQGHIDLGNFAAHGDFDEYDDNKVKDMLDWVKKNLMSM